LSSLSEKQILYFLTQLILLVLTARILADLMRRVGQATVIGELMAGIVLGPSILGKLFPGLERMVFPPDPWARKYSSLPSPISSSSISDVADR
jgi:Kef-type K+ transport system membrane component KefB